MTRHRRTDPYRVAIPWEPSTGLGADFAESLLTGALVAAVIILGDRAIFGQWCEVPAMGFILSACVLGAWIRCRTRGRVTRSPRVASTDDLSDPGKDRVIMVNPKPPGDQDQGADRGDFETFVRGCAVDTSLRRWEGDLGREGYERYRDVLIRLGWAEWRSKDRRQGWALVGDPGEILAAME